MADFYFEDVLYSVRHVQRNFVIGEHEWKLEVSLSEKARLHRMAAKLCNSRIDADVTGGYVMVEAISTVSIREIVAALLR
jgi:hypothetical protein